MDLLGEIEKARAMMDAPASPRQTPSDVRPFAR